MATRSEPTVGGDDSGFSLIETMIAMAILATGLLSMAGVFIMGLSQLAGSSASLIAREKAREAVESVHTARDIRTLAWCEIRNVGSRDRLRGRRRGRVPHRRPAASHGGRRMAWSTPATTAKSPKCRSGPARTDPGHRRRYRTPMTNYTRQIKIADHSSGRMARPNPNLAPGDGHHWFHGGPVAADLHADDLTSRRFPEARTMRISGIVEPLPAADIANRASRSSSCS